MKIERMSQNQIWLRRSRYHVLTYAEEGFSPLNIHTRDANISKDDLANFAKLVNERNEVGTLFPRAAVSALPCTIIRDPQDQNGLCRFIEEFLRENERRIRAKNLLFDFRTPSVPHFIYAEIEDALTFPAASILEHVIVVDDAAT